MRNAVKYLLSVCMISSILQNVSAMNESAILDLEILVTTRMNPEFFDIPVTHETNVLARALERLHLAEYIMNLFNEMQMPIDSDDSRSNRERKLRYASDQEIEDESSKWKKIERHQQVKIAFEKGIRALRNRIDEAQQERVAEGLPRVECHRSEEVTIFVEKVPPASEKLVSERTKSCCLIC